MNSLYFNLTLLLSLGIASTVCAMELPPENNKRKAPDSEIEMPIEKKSKTEAVVIAKDAVCPICQFDAESISKENPNNLTATECCKAFLCRECFNTQHDATKEISKIIDNPEDRVSFVDTYNFEPHALSQVKCPLCRKFFKILPATFEFKDIFSAVKAGDLEAVKQFLATGIDSNCTTDHTQTPLHIAARYGHREIAELLLKSGAHVNAQSKGRHTYGNDFILIDNTPKPRTIVSSLMEGTTPLHLASTNNHVNLVKLLLNNGANIYAKDNNKDTALLDAARHGNLECVNVLLEHGAYYNDANEYYQTPLYYACGNCHKTIAEILLKKGANPNFIDCNHNTPLHRACRGDQGKPVAKRLPVIKTLLENGANPNSINKDGETPLLVVVNDDEDNNEMIVKELVKAGADMNYKDHKGRSPLIYAIKRNDEKTLAFLLNAGADSNTLNENHRTPLHLACKKGNPLMVEELLNHGANVHATTTYNNNTPLHYVAIRIANLSEEDDYWENYQQILQTLLERGAHYSQKNADGDSFASIVSGFRLDE